MQLGKELGTGFVQDDVQTATDAEAGLPPDAAATETAEDTTPPTREPAATG